MKKLTKAQQAVVDKMREGWVLHTTTALTKKGEQKSFISTATYRALWNKDVIELETGFSTICRLTEQYKTAPTVEGI